MFRNSSVVKIYIYYKTQRDQLRKMQLQGLPAGNQTRVLWITSIFRNWSRFGSYHVYLNDTRIPKHNIEFHI